MVVTATAAEPYPNLRQCRVVIRGNGGPATPPVQLPTECQVAAEQVQLPPLYDFATEKRVLAEHEQRQQAATSGVTVTASSSSSTKSATKSDMFAKMKSALGI
eukprot:CAMPEP_0172440374 /NCGR_PEP_ID=MMETSP1065-20121228/1006_1 /TAXON_ID=265537 /ORGANISM="Amphiprora paludosa, Strain CCMP125" /LENGTH=102 /DNA_ID=CAMNT_0013189165 /DNA_START=19 /DNA_END=327 /DNA_ORIENTATION=+